MLYDCHSHALCASRLRRVEENYINNLNFISMTHKMNFKCLSVLLFHNDEDLVEDQINYYKNLNKQDLIVFNHNSTDSTAEIINKYKNDILCIYTLSDKISFKYNKVHEIIYKILLGRNDKGFAPEEIQMSNQKYKNFKYSDHYDWISFPESDEFLEGPNRQFTYYEHLGNLHKQKHINKIKFDNIIYWFTEKDDLSIFSPVKRIKYYSYKKKCGIRVYAWRGSKTIIRRFGHFNKNLDNPNEFVRWKTRHYEMRSKEQFKKKINDRVNITRGIGNHHYRILYDNFYNNKNYGIISSNELHYDNGIDEIKMEKKYDWSKIY